MDRLLPGEEEGSGHKVTRVYSGHMHRMLCSWGLGSSMKCDCRRPGMIWLSTEPNRKLGPTFFHI